MTDYYYSPHPSSKVEDREIDIHLLGHPLVFQTDAGVFSKKRVDFGSRLLLETVEVGSAKKMLDLGCGYGVMGIALAKAYPHIDMIMIDVNQRAVQLAAINAKRNQVVDRVQCLVSEGFSALEEQKFDLILCNPPIRTGKRVVYSLFAEAKAHLISSGSLWIVVRKQQGSASALIELERLYGKAHMVKQKKGYCIIRAQNI